MFPQLRGHTRFFAWDYSKGRLGLGCNFRRAYWESCVSKELASVICFATTGFVSRFRPCVRNRLVFRLGGMLGRECSTQHVVYG